MDSWRAVCKAGSCFDNIPDGVTGSVGSKVVTVLGTAVTVVDVVTLSAVKSALWFAM